MKRSGGGAEDCQVDVDQHGRVRIRAGGMVPGCQDQGSDLVDGRLRHAGALQAECGPRGTAFFVVVEIHVINGVVEPERQFDGRGVAMRAHSVERGEAFFQMLQRMVVAMRFPVAPFHFVE
jgi:hypothetical protein